MNDEQPPPEPTKGELPSEQFKAEVASRPDPKSPEGIAETKKIIAAWKAFGGNVHPDYHSHPKRKTPPKNPGQFTDNERAILLRGVVEALIAKGPDAFDFPIDFRVWAKRGLSRIYFQHDGSWLAYSTTGAAIYGVGLEGTNPKGSIAYGVRTALGLSKAAKKGAIKAEG